MADEMPSLHIDTDWKKQAQEEKRRLAEQEKQKAATPVPTVASEASGLGAAKTQTTGGAPATRGAAREIPVASFTTLVQSFMTQSLYYLGDLAPRGSEPTVNLDMAKNQIDLLSILDDKTKNNLSPEERQMLDAVLYEVRMRYVSVASQYIS